MELFATLRTKASASFDAAHIILDEARVRAAELRAGATSKLQELLTAAKQAASKATQPITTRIARIVQEVQSAKLSALDRVRQARATRLGQRASVRMPVLSLRADVQAKGMRAGAQETATAACLLASEAAAAAQARVCENLNVARAKAVANIELTRQRAAEAKDGAMIKAKELYTATGDLVLQESFQTAAASAAAGAVVLGAGGAATGAVAGGVAGAAAGLPLALFTFGLSVPVGAIVGGGAGIVLGTAAGATTGFLGGGAAGYGVYQKKDEICNAAGSVLAKASEGTECVKGSAAQSVKFAKGMVVAARARFARSGTGGTADEVLD